MSRKAPCADALRLFFAAPNFSRLANRFIFEYWFQLKMTVEHQHPFHSPAGTWHKLQKKQAACVFRSELPQAVSDGLQL